MCNNVEWNRLNKKKKEVVVKDKISDWIENRPKLSRNVRAIENKILKGNSIEYVKGSPLKLHDGTRIYKISEKVIRGGFKEIIIEFSFKSTNSRKITSFKRYRKFVSRKFTIQRKPGLCRASSKVYGFRLFIQQANTKFIYLQSSRNKSSRKKRPFQEHPRENPGWCCVQDNNRRYPSAEQEAYPRS